MTQYKVTAPYVTLAVADVTGTQTVRGFYEGAVVTDPVEGESLDKHLRTGMIEEFAGSEPVEGSEPAGQPAGQQAPARSASKADWVNYAVSQGGDQTEAEASSKDDLIATYGG